MDFSVIFLADDLLEPFKVFLIIGAFLKVSG
jgi:hypothetical protein